MISILLCVNSLNLLPSPVDGNTSCLGPFRETVSAIMRMRKGKKRGREGERESESKEKERKKEREGGRKSEKKNSAEKVYDSLAHYRNPVSIQGENRFKTPY